LICLDTHALIWWLNGDRRLSASAKRKINKALKEERSIFVSSICIWEMCLLIKRGRLRLNMDLEDWLEEAERIPALVFVPVDNILSVHSSKLPGSFHKDPADRIIVALARKMKVPLITADEKIIAYQHVKTLW